jgi:hypothetical protein
VCETLPGGPATSPPPPPPLDGVRQQPHPYFRQSVGRPLRPTLPSSASGGGSGRGIGEESPGSMDKRCRITSGRREPRESATENEPPRRVASAAARVKRCGKSAPRRRQRRRQGKPHREQDRIGTARGFRASEVLRSMSGSAVRVGCWKRRATGVQEEWPSRMRIVVRMPSRTRLIDWLISTLGRPAEPRRAPAKSSGSYPLARHLNDERRKRQRVGISRDWVFYEQISYEFAPVTRIVPK